MLKNEFRACDTQVLGVSVDSRFCHDNWAKSLGGISYPLLQDFHPKGEVAKKYGAYLEDKGNTDRATVIIDKQGVVRYAASVTPAGERNLKEMLASIRRSIRANHGDRTLFLQRMWFFSERAELHDQSPLRRRNHPEKLGRIPIMSRN